MHWFLNIENSFALKIFYEMMSMEVTKCDNFRFFVSEVKEKQKNNQNTQHKRIEEKK